MSGFFELLTRYVSPYYFYIVVVTMIVIFIVAGYYLYDNYSKQKSIRNDAIYQPTDGGKNPTILFFTADWCPHCKSAKPAIDEFERNYKGKMVNGKKLIINRVDCTDSENTEVAKLINTHNVSSFPTIKLVKYDANGDSKTYEFDAKINEKHLEDFVNSTV